MEPGLSSPAAFGIRRDCLTLSENDVIIIQATSTNLGDIVHLNYLANGSIQLAHWYHGHKPHTQCQVQPLTTYHDIYFTRLTENQSPGLSKYRSIPRNEPPETANRSTGPSVSKLIIQPLVNSV